MIARGFKNSRVTDFTSPRKNTFNPSHQEKEKNNRNRNTTTVNYNGPITINYNGPTTINHHGRNVCNKNPDKNGIATDKIVEKDSTKTDWRALVTNRLKNEWYVVRASAYIAMSNFVCDKFYGNIGELWNTIMDKAFG